MEPLLLQWHMVLSASVATASSSFPSATPASLVADTIFDIFAAALAPSTLESFFATM
jgi:hypothetical protein